MDKDPARRQQTAREFAEALGAAAPVMQETQHRTPRSRAGHGRIRRWPIGAKLRAVVTRALIPPAQRAPRS